MRILSVNHTSVMSGAERSLIDLLRAWCDVGDASLACPPHGALPDAARALGFVVDRLPEISTSLKVDPVSAVDGLSRLSLAVARTALVARRRRASLIHANSIRSGLFAVPAGRLAGIPTVVHLRDRLPRGRVADATLRMIGRGAGLVVANSDYTADGLREVSERSAVRVVHNPVDLTRFVRDERSRGRMRAQLRLPQAALCIGVVGQITPWKGQLDAIRALALLRDRFPAAHLLLVGEVKFARRSTRYDNVAYAAELRSEIGRQDLWDRVQLLGERSDLPDVMSAMDVLLVPSWEEPFGRVVIEAMALGVAVIATSVGGTVEIITDGVDGLLLGPREPEAWAAALARLIESAELRSRIGEAAATRAADFDLGIHLAAMRGVFDDAHRNQSGGARRRTASSRLGAG